MKWNNWLFTNYIHHIESYGHTNWRWAELEHEAIVERFGTANLYRLVTSPNVKSVSEKCWLQTYCLYSFLACTAFQVSLSTAEPCVIHTYIYRVSQEECEMLRESVPYVKLYRYNPKHLYPKLNGYGDNGQRKVWTSCISAYCMSTAVLH